MTHSPMANAAAGLPSPYRMPTLSSVAATTYILYGSGLWPMKFWANAASRVTSASSLAVAEMAVSLNTGSTMRLAYTRAVESFYCVIFGPYSDSPYKRE